MVLIKPNVFNLISIREIKVLLGIIIIIIKLPLLIAQMASTLFNKKITVVCEIKSNENIYRLDD